MKGFLTSLLLLICCYNHCLAEEPVGRHMEGDCVNGRGAITFYDGTKYEGQFKDGELSGQGTITFTDGSRYEGLFSNGEINGYGTMTFSDGSKYAGGFKDGTLYGQGTMTFPDGSVYEGEFKDNKYHGKGIWSTPNGIKYEGDFKNGKFDGQGVYSLPDGSKYIGYFKDDHFQGQGAWTVDDTTQDNLDAVHSEAENTETPHEAGPTDTTAMPFPESVEPIETASSQDKGKVLSDGKGAVEEASQDTAQPMADASFETEDLKTVSDDASELAFSVQVGAFLSKENAEKLMELLIEKGYDAQILTINDYHNRPWYAVRIGSYASLDEAQEKAVAFCEKEKMTATVRPIDSL